MPALGHRIKKILARIGKVCRFDAEERDAVRQALSCRGWTDERKLAILYRMAIETEVLEGDILEIGSAWGRSTVLFGLASKKNIWSIDPHTGGVAFIKRGEKQNSYDEFMSNIKRFGLTNRVRTLPYTTEKVGRDNLLPDTTRFSLVFIDGLHTAEGVAADFDLSYTRLVHTGILLFDDYFEPSVPDYTLKIDGMCKETGIALIRDDTSKLVWFFKTEI
jgi:predicted O-methyltransferase YrrM